jgi:signal transduction histidine kinase
VVLVLAAAGYYSLQWLEQQVEKRMQEDIELIARAIRGPLEHALERGREGVVAQSLASAFRFDRVYGAYVYDAAGHRIAASGPQQPGGQSDRLAELAAAGDRRGGYQEAGGKEVYSYFVPLSDSIGRNVGLLQVTRERRDFRDYLARLRRSGVLLLSLFSLGLGGVVAYGHHRIIGRNLKSLVRDMARIERGERDHRPVLRGPCEIRLLGQGMRAMLDSISRSERRLSRQQSVRQRLEERLRQSQKMATIGQLTAGIAHQLGTPLSVVAGKAQRMLRRRDLPPAVAGEFEGILKTVQRMEHIVWQLLDFGRGNHPRSRNITADRLAVAAISQVSEEARQRQVNLTYDGPRPAPDLKVDPVRIEQALVNLLRNAVQAAGSAGEVHFGWFEHGPEAGFSVEDNGPGVPEELRPRLFEPFFTTKPVGQGTGLGLAVAQAAAAMHHGRIEVETAPGGGALFRLVFHRDEKSSDADDKERTQSTG